MHWTWAVIGGFAALLGVAVVDSFRSSGEKPVASTTASTHTLAADSTLYRDSDDSLIHAFRIYYATYEAPVVIAKNFTFFEDHLNEKTLSDGTPYFEWSSQLGSPTKNIEDTGHASVTLGSLAVLLDDKSRLDALLEANNRTERVALSRPLFERFANTFLRIIWKYDYQDPSGLRNILSIIVDGSLASNAKNANGNCAGWIPLAQFNPWMWIRCRDATFHPGVGTANYLNVDNHAALLRYRQFR